VSRVWFEVLCFALALGVFVAVVSTFAFAARFLGYRSPLHPSRRGFRIHRGLSPAEYALAAFRDPSTVLTAATLDMILSGDARLKSISPFDLKPTSGPPRAANAQALHDALQQTDAHVRARSALGALEQMCGRLDAVLQGASLRLTLHHHARLSRRALSHFRRNREGVKLAWMVTAEDAWERLGIMQDQRIDAERRQALELVMAIRKNVITLNDVAAYIARHGEGRYLRWSELNKAVRSGLRGRCTRHPQVEGQHICRYCHNVFCRSCYDGVHRCCVVCLYPYVRLETRESPHVVDGYYETDVPSGVKRVAAGLVREGFMPLLGSRVPEYAELNSAFHGVFLRLRLGGAQVVCAKYVEPLEGEGVHEDLTKIVDVLIECTRRYDYQSTAAYRAVPLATCGVLLLLSRHVGDERGAQRLLRLNVRAGDSGIAARVWVADLDYGKVYASRFFDSQWESDSRPLVAALEQVLHTGRNPHATL